MKLNSVVAVHIWFALFADAVSRVFNMIRILFFASLVAGVLMVLHREHHIGSGRDIVDVLVLWTLSQRLGQWIRIVVKGGGP